MKRIGYLGPEGTFTSQVAAAVSNKFPESLLLKFTTIPQALYNLEQGKIDLAVVPVENSIEGTVNVTLDVLAHELELFILEERVLNITHNLVAKTKDIKDIKKIFSHPQALAQCRKYLEDNFPDIICQSTNSSAEAAVFAAQDESIAAITPLEAAQKYNLNVLRYNTNDFQENKTRFLVVGKNKILPQTEKCKTSIVVAMAENRPGGLYEILEEFARAKINLSKIESRPAKKDLGEYIFFIDCEANLLAEPHLEILKSLEAKCKLLKVLGCYPQLQTNI